MAAHRIDGKAIAAAVRGETASLVAALKDRHGAAPGLAVIQVGDNAASSVYVRNKVKATAEVGLAGREIRLDAEVDQATLMTAVAKLNADPDIDGILVQLPLPDHLDAEAILDAIDPAKDVDGFHPMNAGRLATGRPALVACTPKGCLRLIDDGLTALGRPTIADGGLKGANAVIVGRSNIVGKPMAHLLLSADATVTVAHSKTRDLGALCRTADVLVAAVGRAEMIPGDWIKPGAIVIDVGINRIDTSGGVSRLVGDVAYAEAAVVAGAITPVPGGVGPMTIATLLANTVDAATARRGWHA